MPRAADRQKFRRALNNSEEHNVPIQIHRLTSDPSQHSIFHDVYYSVFTPLKGASFKTDAVALDNMLPDGNGVDIAKGLRAGANGYLFTFMTHLVL